MKQEIRIPEIAEGVTAGTVVALTVAVGDQVEADQTVLELETDKAVVAIPTEQTGSISEILVTEGDLVEVGQAVMLLEAEGTVDAVPLQVSEKLELGAPAEQPSSPMAEPVPAQLQAEAVEKFPASATAPAEIFEKLAGEQNIAAAAPSVRRLARELGVDIHQVQGTGARGRIGAEDVNDFVCQTMQRVTGGGIQPAEFPGLHAQRQLPDFSRFGETSREPLSRVRELTADAMSYAWSTIPMVTQYDKVSIGPVEKFRKQFNVGVTPETKLTITAFLLKVCATALKAFPRFNSVLDLASRELVVQHYINIGVAVDTPHGLLVPVLREVDQKGVEKIGAELNQLAEKTRERRISPAEMEGGTFTISNLGGIGGTAFTPIVYAPQVAILGVSEAEIQPVWNGVEFEPELVMSLCLTYDHRVIDGAAGARFLRWICQALENPLNLVMKG